MKKKLTIKDIAREAEVSFKTVSRVLNNEKFISDKTREKVLKVIKEKNFSLNYNASRLSQKNTKQIALVTNTSSTNMFNKNFILMNNIVNRVLKKGYHILVYTNFSEVKKNVFGMVDNGFYEGIIFLNPKDIESVRISQKSNIPVVTSGFNEEFIFVGTNQKESSYIATKVLIEKGCDDIAILLDDKYTTTTQEKLKGYIKALEEFNMKIDDENILYNISKSVDVEKYIEEKIKTNSLAKGLVINADFPALGAINAIHKYGIKCPQDIKIITFGGTEVCDTTYPTLSSMKQKFDLIAEKLVEKIICMIEDENYTPESSIIPPEYIERESSK